MQIHWWIGKGPPPSLRVTPHVRLELHRFFCLPSIPDLLATYFHHFVSKNSSLKFQWAWISITIDLKKQAQTVSSAPQCKVNFNRTHSVLCSLASIQMLCEPYLFLWLPSLRRAKVHSVLFDTWPSSLRVSLYCLKALCYEQSILISCSIFCSFRSTVRSHFNLCLKKSCFLFLTIHCMFRT
jgi:hypothetical protein